VISVTKSLAAKIYSEFFSTAPSANGAIAMQVQLNGNINLASLQSILQADMQLAHTLHVAGLHAFDAANMLRLRALDRSSDTNIRLDLRVPHCLWLNDLEKDELYT
jgi:hypothetical protein